MKRTAIIGGGISGLTVALLLRGKGHDIRLFEASDEPGGAIRTTRNPDGWMAEWGPNTIIESSNRIKQLIAMLDLEQRRRYPDKAAQKRYIVRGGKTVPVPVSPGRLLTSPLLSVSAKMRILREPFHRQSRKDHDESLADFVRRRLGEEFLKGPIDALVGGIYAGDPERLSVRHAFPRLALLEEQHGSLILGQIKGGVDRPPASDEIPRNKAAIFSFDKGLQVLPEEITRRLGDAVSFGTAVTELVQTSDSRTARWRVHLSGETQPPDFDNVVYAGTSFGLSGMALPESLSDLLAPVEGIPHPPVTSFTMGFRRSDIAHPLDGFGVLVPGAEGFSILGTLFTSTLFPNRAPRHHVTLTTYLGGSRQPDIAEMDEEQQAARVLSDLNKLLGLSGEPLFTHRIHWPRAIPQYETGFGRILEQMDRAEREHPGFYLAGNYRTGISVGDTIHAAFDLAERIAGEQDGDRDDRTAAYHGENRKSKKI